MSPVLPRPPYVIVGLGLVGGSLARALRAARPELTVWAVEPDAAVREQAQKQGLVEQAFARVGPELAQAGLVVVCVPLPALAAVLGELGAVLAPGTLVTDVVGIKAPVAAAVRAALPQARYAGSHPMAGGARGGFGQSKADLFSGRTVVVCPGTSGEVREVIAVWELVGGNVVLLSEDEHDRVVAATSHLPYLAALSLVRVAAREEHGEHVAGRGFADATSRADFDPEIMAAVVAANPHVPAALRALASELNRLAELCQRSPAALVEEAHAARAAHQALLSAEPSGSRAPKA